MKIVLNTYKKLIKHHSFLSHWVLFGNNFPKRTLTNKMQQICSDLSDIALHRLHYTMQNAHTTRCIFAVFCCIISIWVINLNDKEQLEHNFRTTTGWQCRRFRWIGIAKTVAFLIFSNKLLIVWRGDFQFRYFEWTLQTFVQKSIRTWYHRISVFMKWRTTAIHNEIAFTIVP